MQTPNTEDYQAKISKIGTQLKTQTTYLLIIAGVLVVAIIGFIIFGITFSNNITSNRNNISSAQQQIATLQTQLSSANSQISSLTAQLASSNTQISSLSNQLTSANSQISTLTPQLTTAKSQITTLQNGLSAATTQISALADQSNTVNSQITALQNAVSPISGIQTQITAINTQLTSLQSMITSLSTQISNYSTTNNQTTLFTSQSISQNANSQTTVYTYTPTYAGVIYLSGTSSSATGYIRVANNSLGTSTNYPFGTGTAISAPVTGGYNYSIIFGNTDSTGIITATIIGYNFASSTSTTNQTTLFASQSVYQSANTQTQIYTFTTIYSGTVYVSGNSSSATGYIKFLNNTTGATNSYTFGTGTTINASVTAGSSYSIYFGNTDVAGTITATLSGTYYHY